jgi:coenzyme F420-reducing hydrogenase delta subunit/ferredoxin
MTTTEQQSSTAAAGVFEPTITAFVCKWCTYAGADLAGTSRMVYSPNVRTLMLPCTGRIDVSFVIRAFLQGADGVVVSGCHPGDCHYTAGNFRARRRWTLFRDLLDVAGVDLRRVEIAWISAAEGAKWVKTIEGFTDRIRQLGPYTAMKEMAGDHQPQVAPKTAISDVWLKASRSREVLAVDSQLVAAVAEALSAGKVKAVVGWTKSPTLSRPRPAWFTTAESAAEMVQPAEYGNLARLLKNPQLRSVTPIGIVARASEMLSLNVLAQESQIDPKQVFVFAISPEGKLMGVYDFATAGGALLADSLAKLKADQPAGFSAEVLAALDELMAKTPDQRFAFWREQFARCIKCYACRGACPMCNCTQCFADRNSPQWISTAADGPGNFGWQLIRAFHLAGRCVGCGACQDACPGGIPLNLLSAAAARSALKNFGHRAGVDPAAIPLQSDFRPDDGEAFIV